MQENNELAENFIKISESKMFNIVKILIVVAFFLGGWAANLQVDQINSKKKDIAQDIEIKKIQKGHIDIQLLIATDMPTIKSILVGIQDDIKEIKADQKNN